MLYLTRFPTPARARFVAKTSKAVLGVSKIEKTNLDIQHIIRIFLSRLWILLLITTVTGGLGYQYVSGKPKVYESTSTLLVQQRRSDFTPGISDLSGSDQLAVTYATLVKSTPFLNSVSVSGALPLAPAELKGMISTSVGARPPLFSIRIRSSDPGLTQTVANTLATEFIAYIIDQRLIEVANFQAAAAAQGLENSQNQVAAQFGLLDSLTLLEPASRPGHQILPRVRETVIVAIIVGAGMSIMIILSLNSLRDTIGSPEVLSRRFGIASLGTISKWSSKDIGENEIIISKFPSSSYSEAFRQFRTNLQFAVASRPSKFLLVTSPGPGEGKTTVLCNLASVIAQTGKRVIIVDGDLRRPAIHRRFQLQNRDPGLSSFLAQPNTNIGDVLIATEQEGVAVVPSGPIPPNPSELLGSSRMEELLQQLGKLADVVLLDSPPLLVVADTAVIAAQADGVILVGDGQNTKTKSLKAALDILSQTQVKILGLVLNKLTHRRFGYGYGYAYGYNYGYAYKADEIDTGADTMANGRQPAYRRPLLWARSALSKLSRSKDLN